MLLKLAQAAEWLDSRGLYAAADALTHSMLRIAQNQVWGEEPEEEETPEPAAPWAEEYQARVWHDEPGDIRPYTPEFLEKWYAHEPEDAHAYTEHLRRHPKYQGHFGKDEYLKTRIEPEKETAVWMNGRKVWTPYGTATNPRLDENGNQVEQFGKKLRDDLNPLPMFYDQYERENNAERMKKYYEWMQKQGKNKALDLDYFSRSAPSEEKMSDQKRRMLHVPRAMPLIEDELGRLREDNQAAQRAKHGTHSEKGGVVLPSEMQMPLLSEKELREVLDPSNPRGQKLQQRMQEEGRGYGWLLSQGLRNLNPESVFGRQRALKQTDPDTGKKRPFAYPRV